MRPVVVAAVSRASRRRRGGRRGVAGVAAASHTARHCGVTAHRAGVTCNTTTVTGCLSRSLMRRQRCSAVWGSVEEVAIHCPIHTQYMSHQPCLFWCWSVAAQCAAYWAPCWWQLLLRRSEVRGTQHRRRWPSGLPCSRECSAKLSLSPSSAWCGMTRA